MQIDRVLYPITTLGPGNRLVIWVIGCSKHCRNCANPELWHADPAKETDAEELFHAIRRALDEERIDGVTITGGDPLEQMAELNRLLPLLKSLTDDILVYTGYTVEEVREALPESEWQALQTYVSVLIDGPYVDELNDGRCPLRGSTNQRLIFFDAAKQAIYAPYLEQGRTVQNVFYGSGMISVGIHGKGK